MTRQEHSAAKARIHAQMRRIEICTRRLCSDSFQGGVQSRFRGRGMDFDEVREYAIGDDVRAIDWNATARTGRTFVKKFREERQLSVIFVVDMSASGALGAGERTKRDQAVEIAGVLCLAALRSDHRVGLVLFTYSVERFVPPSRGRAHALRIVHELLEHEPKGTGTNVAAALRMVRERQQRRSVVIVVSDFLMSNDAMGAAQRELRALAHRHDVVAIRTGDAHDRALPSVGLLTVEDAETGEVVELDTSSAKQRARLEAAVAATDAKIRGLARGARVDMLEVDTMRAYLGPLVGFFRSRGVRS